MKSSREKEEALKAAVAWVHQRGGAAATLEAFGDAGAVNEAWGLEVQEFKEFCAAGARRPSR